MKTKFCSKCKKDKSLKEFHNYRTMSGKITKRADCKDCRKRRNNKSRSPKNKDKRAEYLRDYNIRNSETIRRKKQECYQKRKEHYKKSSMQYYQSHKKQRSDYAKKYKEEHREELNLKKRKSLKEYFQKLNRKKKEEKEKKFHKEQVAREIYKKNLIEEQRARNKEHYDNWRKENREKLRAQKLGYYRKKMKEIHGDNWETIKYKGEELTHNVLKSMFPYIKILRGFEGSIDTLGTCSVRKHIWPDFSFSLLDRKIVIEYNGDQHYKCFPPITPKRFVGLQKRDRWLRKYCKKNNIILIEIRQRKVGYSKNKIEAELRTELTKHGIL